MPDAMKVAAAALAAVLLADYFYTAWTWIGWNSRSAMGQDPWLQYALAVREGSGPPPFGNDHPLYPALLSLWVERDPAAFTWSKLFSLAVGLLTLACTWRVGSRLAGTGAGLAAAALLSVDWIFLSLSFSLRAEVLLPLLFLLAWYATLRGFEDGPHAGRWWLGAGVATGLAYLAKGTAPIFAAAWLVGLAASWQKPRVLKRSAWYLAGFVPVAALLWWANRELFGTAGQNFSIQRAVWLDSWWELQDRSLESLTFSNYLSQHGWTGIVRRQLAGMRDFLPLALATLSPAETFPLARALRWPLLAGALAAAWLSRRVWTKPLRLLDGGAWFTASLFAAFLILFSWYHQVSPSERFVGPLAPIVFILFAAAAREALGAWKAPRKRELAAASAGLVAALTLVSLGIKAADWGWARPFATDRLPPCVAKAVEAAGSGRRTAYGPSDDLPRWLLSPRADVLDWPARDPLGWLDASTVEQAVVDLELAGRLGLSLSRPPKGWSVAWLDEHAEPHVAVWVRTKGRNPADRSGGRG